MAPPRTMPQTVDHVIQGLVTIRLDGAPPEVLRGLERAFGPSRGDPAAEPDVEIDFTEALPRRPSLRLLGLNEAAFDEDGFYLLGETGRRARLDFTTLGERFRMTCENGASIPLLLPIVGLRLLRKDHLLLHSAAFIHRGSGTVVTGWQKGGKTEMLLAFLNAGADYLSDEWSIISPDGELVYGLPSILQVWSWHLRHLPRYWARLTSGERSRLRLLRLYQRAYGLLPGERRATGFPLDLMHRLSLEGGIASVGQVRALPDRLAAGQISYSPTPVDVVFLATVADGPTRVRTIDGAEVADRMAASLHWERRGLLSAYEQFRFAFPDRRSAWLEGARERELELLRRAFAGKRCVEVSHPYPVPLGELYEAAAPVFDR